MARLLSSEEAAVFNENLLANEQFSAFMSDFAEGLMKHQEKEPELTPETGFWLTERFPGS
jgi:hypothetical protein